jgi:Domain of unknown function (DUF1836).
MDANRLPGTTIECKLTLGIAETIFDPMFLSGGLILSQATELLGIEGYMVQNWVKRKYLVPPENKKYSKRQFARLMIINFLKDSFTFDQIVKLLSYVNGVLADYSDDTINDYELYSYFVNTLVMTTKDDGVDLSNLSSAIDHVIGDYVPAFDYSKDRLKTVLEIMVTSYQSLLIRRQALNIFFKLDNK